MSGTRSVWFSSAIFFALLATCLCLECYDCASKDDPICLDPFDEDANADGTSECDEKQQFCGKFKTVSFLADSGFITGKDREVTVVSRMCIRRDGHREGCVATEADSGFHFLCLCSSDLCNSGTTTLPNMVILGISAMVALWMAKR